ncbi:MAG: hypothetical protein WAL30_03370 [Candidatus Aquirickettsiella sp.]
MKHYAAFLEGITPIEEKKLASFLFNQLYKHLKSTQKKTKPIKIDVKNEKIWLRERLFFHFDSQTRLLESECAQACKAALIEASKDFLYQNFTDFFKNIKFANSKEIALMLSNNGLLFSQSPRIHKNKNIKKLVSFNGIVSSEFAIEQILACNSGLIFGHAHDDTSSYAEIIRLMPSYKLQKIKILYLELPYNIFLPLFSDFNQKKSGHKLIINELKKRISKLYQDKTFLKGFAALLLAARDHGIAIQACDVNSLNFNSQSRLLLDKKRRLKVGNACIVRSIEALQVKQHHPKFLLLVGLAHAQAIANELGLPSCAIGNKLQAFSSLTQPIDYSVTLSTLDASNSKFLTKFNARLDQTLDPKINEIISHWDVLIKKIPKFSSIAVREITAAREVYLEYILKKSHRNKCEISDTCKTQQSLVIESLTQAIYSKFVELAHPKNWYPLFYCQRPYGIRLTKNEINAFTITHLDDLETSKAETSIMKLHYT